MQQALIASLTKQAEAAREKKKNPVEQMKTLMALLAELEIRYKYEQCTYCFKGP
jgi:hypothetical protein